MTCRIAPVIALLCISFPGPAICQSEATTRSVTIPEIRRIEADRSRRTDVEKKMSSQLLDALSERRNGAVISTMPRLRAQPIEAAAGKTLVDIDANVDDALLNAIRQAGGSIVNAHPEDHAIRAYVPLDRIESIAGNSRVNFIAPADKAIPQAILFDKEGEIGHAADKTRELFHVDGTGIKVGIISDSIDDDQNSLENAYQTGAVDRNLVQVISGQAGNGKGEGLAMAELVHAIAPGASISFATGNGGQAQMAANIRALQEAGCDIIVDDLGYFAESPFQDGPIGRAISQVTAKGVLYFSAAGNGGSKRHNTSSTWEGDFKGTGTVGEGETAQRLHEFAPGIAVNRVVRGGQFVSLFWADPLRRSSNQYSLYVIDADGHVLRSSTSSHTGVQDPYQGVRELKAGEGIVITKNFEAAPLFIHLDSGGAVLSIGTGGATRGHNATGARNAFSVAAVEAAVPPELFGGGLNIPVENFSSDGPRRIFFNADGSPITPGNFSSRGGRMLVKPDIAAADGVTTTLPRGRLNPFHGTSAAAPHAAAIAALVLSYDHRLNPEQVREFLLKSALPIDGGSEGTTAGAGIVMAFEAVRAACLQKQPFCADYPDASGTSASNSSGSSSQSNTNSSDAAKATEMLLK
jgi:hypothetical protein